MEQRFPFLHSLQDLSIERGKLHSFLIFLALSFFFWMITKFSNQYTEILNFEVSVENFPKGLVPTSETSSKVQMTLSASGFQLLFYKLFVNKINIDSDKGVFKDGLASISLDLSIKNIQNQLSGTSEIRAFFPSILNIEYSKLDNKRIPVKLPSSFDIASGFGISEPLIFKPDSINVIGTSNILDTLNVVYVNPNGISELKESFRDQFNLYNPAPNRVEFSQSSVFVEVFIDRFSEKTIEVPVRLFNVPDSIALKLFPGNVQLTFSASLVHIKKIDESDFMISCDYNSIKDGDEVINLKLISKPSQLKSLRWTPKQVEYLIRK